LTPSNALFLDPIDIDELIFEFRTVQDSEMTAKYQNTRAHTSDQMKMTILAKSADAAKALLSDMTSTSQTDRAVFFSAAVDDDFAVALAKALSTACRSLPALHLLHTSISPLGARHLATGLLLHGRLRTLDLSDSPCGDAGCAHLAALLPACASLRALSLRGDRIGPDGAAALALALSPPPAGSAAGPASPAARLAPRPAGPSRLESLDLRRNVVGDAGAAALAEALARGAPLRELDVSGNWVTGRGAAALAAALRGNARLRGLTVRATVVDGQGRMLAALQEEEERGPAVRM
jgi:hypothetical protein